MTVNREAFRQLGFYGFQSFRSRTDKMVLDKLGDLRQNSTAQSAIECHRMSELDITRPYRQTLRTRSVQ